MLSVEDLKTYQKALAPAYTIEAERNYVKLSLSYLKSGNQDYTDCDFDRAFLVLFNWCQNVLLKL